MPVSNATKRRLKAPSLSLILLTSGLLLAGCGGGGGADSPAPTQHAAPSTSGTPDSTNKPDQGSQGNNSSSAFRAVSISAQPANQAVSQGQTVQMSVTATGTGPLSYQWYFNGTAISGATSATLRLANVSPARTGRYYCEVSNQGSSDSSAVATLTVTAVARTGSALITWSAPTRRADGSPLRADEIRNYNLYHSDTANGSLESLVSPEADDFRFVVDDLVVGTHYFALSTTDTNNQESIMSARIAVTIE